MVAAITLLVTCYPAGAMQKPVEGTFLADSDKLDADEIHVVGRTTNFTLDGKLLRKIEKQFREKRSIYAPQADLRYRIIATDMQKTDDIVISIEHGKQTTTIRPQANGFINLPATAFQKGAIITANKNTASIQLLPEVMSPQFSDDKRRMGDLRLQCRLMWILKSPSVPLPAKAAFGLAGGVCNSKKIAISFSTQLPIKKATLIRPNQEPRDIEVQDGSRYRPPLFDKEISNDSSIILR